MQRIIHLGSAPLPPGPAAPAGDFCDLLGRRCYRIANVDAMPPFFMSIVSSADLWMFISSSGALTAGRVDADSALFPYAPADRIEDARHVTGSVTAILATRGGRTQLWEPFAADRPGPDDTRRNLYKSLLGDFVLFEERNNDLALLARQAWCFSPAYGIVRQVWLQNVGPDPVAIELLDGLRNLLPYGANSKTQMQFSNLLDAYKLAELAGGDLGVFSLTAGLTDLAQPRESLMATTVWQEGLAARGYLLSTNQLDRFRSGRPATCETRVEGQRGAFLACASFALPAGGEQAWRFAADLNRDHTAVHNLALALDQDRRGLARALEADIRQGSASLRDHIARADGLQLDARETDTAHHQANVLFNIMRGGIFPNGYAVETDRFRAFLREMHAAVADAAAGRLAALPATLTISALRLWADQTGLADLARLVRQYLPLTFSRRHGDPTRPWNHFTIRVQNADGSPRHAYEGNWRDIFQNWEALALSFPDYLENMIAVFLNATTLDGYNPYRIAHNGIDWECPEPDSPWSNIGYWSDHQIAYLQRLMDAHAHAFPGLLRTMFTRHLFSTAAVPYRIRPYDALCRNPRASITFDHDANAAVRERVRQLGADGRLVADAQGQIIHVSLAEKLLVLLLAKLGCLVPGGGLWMQTQRPEWNDANNALAGFGLSVVTTCYLRRFIAFFRELIADGAAPIDLGVDVADWLAATCTVLAAHDPATAAGDPAVRRAVMDGLGQAASDYRARVYTQGRRAAACAVPAAGLASFLDRAGTFLDATIRVNRRADGLYHSYNILHLEAGQAQVATLVEMLEGQVAALSAGLLAPPAALALLAALRRSRLYREDQDSYMLYPRGHVNGFMERNTVDPLRLQGLVLLETLHARRDPRILSMDDLGQWHFNGHFRSLPDLEAALEALARDPELAPLVSRDAQAIRDAFEATFHHRGYTGRSASMFAYEGVGSVYWHMVSKLLVAAQEAYLAALAQDAPEAEALRLCQAQIRAGLGASKSPRAYGAFPTDPYSHTPWGAGARQPGMTGQVKEGIVCRLMELGIVVRDGRLAFVPACLQRLAFTDAPAEFRYVDVDGQPRSLMLPAASVAFTVCQVPIVVRTAARNGLTFVDVRGRRVPVVGLALDPVATQHIFARDGVIAQLEILVAPAAAAVRVAEVSAAAPAPSSRARSTASV